MQPKTMPRLSPSFLPTLAVLIFFISFGADGEYDCEPTRCGVVQNISYPFWVSGAQSPHCGHPAFELNCEDDRRDLVLAKPFPRYGVGQIPNGDIRCFRFFSIEFITSKSEANDCPNDLSDGVSLDDLHIIQITKKLILLDCSSNAANEHDDCLTFVSSPYFALDYNNISWKRLDDPAKNHCKMQLTIPLLPYYQTENTLDICDLEKWSDPDDGKCSNCSSDGGGPSCFSHQSLPEAFCRCDDGQHRGNCNGESNDARLKKKIIIGSVAGVMSFLLMGALSFICVQKGFPSTMAFGNKSKSTQNIEAFLNGYGSIFPKRYKYSDLKRITKSFGEKLGQGGFGSVFKGALPDGQLVAVKILSSSKENGEDFINEVVGIGRTSHVNIVSLLGFCIEGSKRALIYQFMPNGSLDKYIYSDKPKSYLPWDKLHQIAIGIARGLEYLHLRCNTRIVHFDIKPHNILLDQNFCPKISDFGLAKLCTQQEGSQVSMRAARGTIGYIAPELISRTFGMVSTKSDVYSYGMMVLEMVGGRRNVKVCADRSSEVYFPHWVYEHFVAGGDLEVCDVTDETNEIARKMILVGLWCIQTMPKSRPSISRVVEMLEGSVCAIQVPPKPYFSST